MDVEMPVKHGLTLTLHLQRRRYLSLMLGRLSSIRRLLAKILVSYTLRHRNTRRLPLEGWD
jgi:hypothetical protein